MAGSLRDGEESLHGYLHGQTRVRDVAHTTHGADFRGTLSLCLKRTARRIPEQRDLLSDVEWESKRSRGCGHGGAADLRFTQLANMSDVVME